jgi:DNA-binding transcriptional ArsR family regulator
MLRIWLTGEDLARIRLAPGPDLGMELTLSLDVLATGSKDLRYELWRRGLAEWWHPGWHRLTDFCAPRYASDLFDDAVVPDPSETAANLIGVPTAERRDALRALAAQRRLTPFARAVATGDPDTTREFGRLAAAYQAKAILPVWDQLRALADADRSVRGAALTVGGVERLLSTLHPTIAWYPPVLQVRSVSGDDVDVHLGGKGLVLLPAVFTLGKPVLALEGRFENAPTLVYPAGHGGLVLGPSEPRPTKTMASLLGRGRAAALEAIALAQGCSSTELARALGSSAASASQHASVLRAAGLIVTRRTGGSVRHTITQLGRALLGEASRPH